MKFKPFFLISFFCQFAFSQLKTVLIACPQKFQFHRNYVQIPSQMSVLTPKGEQKQSLSDLKFFNHTDKKFIHSKKKNAHISFGILSPKTGERPPDYDVFKFHKNSLVISGDSERGRFYRINTLSQFLEHYKDLGRIPTVRDIRHGCSWMKSEWNDEMVNA